MRQLEQERGQREQWGRDIHGIAVAADPDAEHGDMGGFHAGSIPQLETAGIRTGKEDAADTLRQRLQIAVQRGGLRPEEATAIFAAARYTGAYHWSPPDAGICGVVDGISDFLHPGGAKNKGARIKACGNGQVPLAAAAAWLALTGP